MTPSLLRQYPFNCRVFEWINFHGYEKRPTYQEKNYFWLFEILVFLGIMWTHPRAPLNPSIPLWCHARGVWAETSIEPNNLSVSCTSDSWSFRGDSFGFFFDSGSHHFPPTWKVNFPKPIQFARHGISPLKTEYLRIYSIGQI